VEVFERENGLLKDFHHRYSAHVLHRFGAHFFERVHVAVHELPPLRSHRKRHERQRDKYRYQADNAQTPLEGKDRSENGNRRQRSGRYIGQLVRQKAVRCV
jgi:hypothetical protein